MPQVPYSPVPGVTPSASVPGDYFSQQATPADFGSQVGAAVLGLGQQAEKAGEVAGEIAVQQQQRANNIAVDKAYNGFQDQTNAMLAGDPNKPGDQGYFGLRGQAAVDARAGLVQSLEDSRQAIKDGLGNQAQQLAFEEQSRRLSMYTAQRIDAKYEQEFTSAALLDNQAGAAIRARSAAIDYNNEGHFQALLADDGAKADAKSAMQGADPHTEAGAAIFAYNRMEGAQALYLSRAVAMGNADPAAGLAFVQANADKFDAISLHRLTDEFNPKAKNQAVAAGISQTMAAPLPGGAPVAGTPAALDADTRTRAQLVHDTAVQQGASDDEAWGWAANAVHESGAKAAPEPGDGGISHGMFQLNKDQLAKYQATHDGHLPEQDSVATQLQFARTQASPSLTGAQGPGGYAAAISTGFEVPAGGQTEAANRAATADALAGPAGGTGQVPGAGAAPSGHDATSYGVEFQRMQMARTEAQRLFPNDQLAQRQMVDGVWQEIQQANTLQAKYEAEQAKATRDAQQAVGQTFINQILTDPKSFDPVALSKAPALTWEQKNDLFNIAQRRLRDVAGGKEAQDYGPGFWAAFQQVHADAKDPNRITYPSQLWGRGGPNGDLSLAGIKVLTGEIDGARTPEGAAMGKTVESYLSSAHLAISGHGMMGGARDPVGEMNFTRFLPAAFAEIEKEKAAGMSPVQMMQQGGPLDQLVKQATRSPAQMMQDMLGANNPDLPETGAGGSGGTAAAGAGKAPVDLTTAAGVTAAYKSGYFGVGPAAYDKAAAELRNRGFVKPPAAAAPGVPH
jgi:hypothetical protein